MPRAPSPRAAAAARLIGGSVPKDSDQRRAHQAMTRHSFAPGRGYWEHGGPPVIHTGPAPAPQCDPPLGIADGSRHFLAKGGKRLPFTWVAAERAWARPGGLRMAFTAEYLTREGWKYAGPVA